MEDARSESVALLALPKISLRDIDDLAGNPVVIRLMAYWDVLSEGMSDSSKKALLWEAFSTIRASYDIQAKAIRNAGRIS